MATLQEDFAAEVRLLQERFGVVIGEEVYSPKHFGNARLELVCEELLIRITRDRGEEYLEVRLWGTEWTPVEAALERLRLNPRPGLNLNVREAIGVLCSADFGRAMRTLGVTES